MKKQQSGFGEAYLFIAVAVLIISLLAGVHFLYKDNKNLSGQVAQKNAVIEIQKDSIEKDAKSDKVTESVTTETQVKKDEVVKKAGDISRKTDDKVDQINREAAAKEAAAKDAAEKYAIETNRINSVSAARIDGLWDTYCLAVPSDEGCKPAAPAKAAGIEELEQPVLVAAAELEPDLSTP